MPVDNFGLILRHFKSHIQNTGRSISENHNQPSSREANAHYIVTFSFFYL